MAKYLTVNITRKGGPPEAPPSPPPTPPVDNTERCSSCHAPLSKERLAESLWVCPHCDHHHPMAGPERIRQMADAGTWHEIGGDLRPTDPLLSLIHI